jgi:hypothetical protein
MLVFEFVMVVGVIPYNFGENCCLHLQKAYCALKREATGSSETVVLIYDTTKHQISEDGSLILGCF